MNDPSKRVSIMDDKLQVTPYSLCVKTFMWNFKKVKNVKRDKNKQGL